MALLNTGIATRLGLNSVPLCLLGIPAADKSLLRLILAQNEVSASLLWKRHTVWS